MVKKRGKMWKNWQKLGKIADFAGKVTGELHAFDRFLHYVVLPD